jgi:hypothetical protein
MPAAKTFAVRNKRRRTAMSGGTKPHPGEKDTFQDGQHKGGGVNQQTQAGPGRPSKTPPGTERGGAASHDAPPGSGKR